MSKLPTKLKEEPIVDAVFEVRFKSNFSVADVLPGFLISRLGNLAVNRSPIADIPKVIRDRDPNLEHATLVTLEWKQFVILLGNKSIGLGCKLPYPGWGSFKAAIMEISKIANELSLFSNVERISLKYVDLIPSEGLAEQLGKIRLNITLGDLEINNHQLNFRVEVNDDQCLHIITVANSAISPVKQGLKGVIVDVDTIFDAKNEGQKDWFSQLEQSLDYVHSSNKTMFFNCLTNEAVEALGPVYE